MQHSHFPCVRLSFPVFDSPPAHTCFPQAVVNDDLLPAVKALIAAGANVDQADWSGLTPMHWACFLGASANLKALLDAKADARAVDDHRRTPLHRAAERDNEACVAMLLDGSHVGVDAVDVSWPLQDIVYFYSFVHESIVLSFFRTACIADTVAIPLHRYRIGQYTTPPRPPYTIPIW